MRVKKWFCIDSAKQSQYASNIFQNENVQEKEGNIKAKYKTFIYLYIKTQQ